MSSPTLPTASSARTKSTPTKSGGPAADAMNSRRKPRPHDSSRAAAVEDQDSASPDSGPVPWAAYAMYFALAIVGGSIDLFSKEAVFRTFGMPTAQPTWWLIQDRL